MTRRRLAIVIASAATALAVCSCDSSPSVGATATPTPTAVALDHCLVGTWKSMTISGNISIAGARVTLSGGAGEVLTIAASGSLRTDDNNTAPLTGAATDGTAYKLAQTGTATGTISATAGRIAVKLDQPTQLTVSLYRNGALLQSQHPGSATDSYTCTAGSSLVITGGGGTVSTYSPG
jgi:hypothetical protein